VNADRFQEPAANRRKSARFCRIAANAARIVGGAGGGYPDRQEAFGVRHSPYFEKEIAMRTLLCISVSLVIVVAGLSVATAPSAETDKASAGKVYELRTYKTEPGKLDALHARFRDHTCRLFKKHGIEVLGFWTPTEGKEATTTLIYIVAFPSVEAQKVAWQAFRADPEWMEVKAASEKDGVLARDVQSKNLKATDYSPLR
jgi:hypothetical protein